MDGRHPRGLRDEQRTDPTDHRACVVARQRVEGVRQHLADRDRDHEEHHEQRPRDPEQAPLVLAHAIGQTPHAHRTPSARIELNEHVGAVEYVVVERKCEQPVISAGRIGAECDPLTVLDDATVVEHDDLIDLTQRRQPMCDHDGGAATHQRVNRFVQRRLGRRVDARRRLVEHHDVGVTQPHPRHREQLRLTGRQSRTARAEPTVDAASGERREPHCLERRFDLAIGWRVVEQRDVVADRAADQLDLLGHERDATPQVGQRDVADRHAAEQHRAGSGVDETEHEPAERRLAAARCGRSHRPSGRRRSRVRRRAAPGRRRRTRSPPRRTRWTALRQRRARAFVADRRLDREQLPDPPHRAVRLLHGLEFVHDLFERALDQQDVLEQQERGARG